MLESLFNEVAGFYACNFIEKRLQHRYFLVNIEKNVRTPKEHLQTVASAFSKVFFMNFIGANFHILIIQTVF